MKMLRLVAIITLMCCGQSALALTGHKIQALKKEALRQPATPAGIARIQQILNDELVGSNTINARQEVQNHLIKLKTQLAEAAESSLRGARAETDAERRAKERAEKERLAALEREIAAKEKERNAEEKARNARRAEERARNERLVALERAEAEAE